MATSSTNSSARRKLALIIGNNNYTQPYNKLRYSINNAKDLTFLLTRINFSIVQYIDVDNSMMEKIKNFSQTIDDDDLVLFYFSGHVFWSEKEKFFIPVDDAKIESDIDVQMMGVNVERALKRLTNENPSGITVLILDCYQRYVLESSRESLCK